MPKAYWISHPIMTVCVEVDERMVITKAAPIVRKFKGQSVFRLLSWLRSKGSGLLIRTLK